ncbi:GNAT family N-acetyltransferase [Sediminitomix flava]|uniref:Ribosomal protein S18 acetylase RimI-like enzyme n=1 Tax=Sediminitomix flava TaxID=379075 RepID=A0A315Z9B9_SEDFL|nr:N-acetyltransferase [Sediminitomix flava]PWJ40146.1 ribosomal protein S18 acetylase RimI-like enzyme [Sediminitomix flava]
MNTEIEITTKIRKAEIEDYQEIWEIIDEVIRTGDTYVFSPSSDKQKMLRYWCSSDKFTYVLTVDDKIVGTFILKENQPDLGSHVCNAAFMVDPKLAGQGIGYQMGAFALEEAKKLGFKAMQFNIVVKTNEAAVALWKKLGFEIVGEVPEVFNHAKEGYTSAYIMWRKL